MCFSGIFPSRSSDRRWHMAVPLPAAAAESGKLGQFHSGHAALQHTPRDAPLVGPGRAACVCPSCSSGIAALDKLHSFGHLIFYSCDEYNTQNYFEFIRKVYASCQPLSLQWRGSVDKRAKIKWLSSISNEHIVRLNIINFFRLIKQLHHFLQTKNIRDTDHTAVSNMSQHLWCFFCC